MRAVAQVGALLKELIQDFGALGQGRPDLVPVDAFADSCAAVAD